MPKGTSGNIALPVTALTPEQIAAVVGAANEFMISRTAVMRQAIAQFLDLPEDTQAPFIMRDYLDVKPFTNVYCSQDWLNQLDALSTKFDQPRNQIIRAAVEFYFKKKGGNN